MTEYIVNTNAEEARWRAMGADYSAFFKNRLSEFMGNPVHETIVRCRDCKYSYEEETVLCSLADRKISRKRTMCGYWTCDHIVKPGGFCAWGERRSDGSL